MRIEIRKDVIRKFNMVLFVLFCIVSVTMGIMGYRVGIKKETEKIEDIYVDNGIDDLINKRSTEYNAFIYYDGMYVDENGDYYVNTGIGGLYSTDAGTYSQARFSKEYVESQKDRGIEGELVTVNKSLYDINK